MVREMFRTMNDYRFLGRLTAKRGSVFAYNIRQMRQLQPSCLTGQLHPCRFVCVSLGAMTVTGIGWTRLGRSVLGEYAIF